MPGLAGLSESFLHQVRQFLPAEGITSAADLAPHSDRVLLRHHPIRLLAAKGDENPLDRDNPAFITNAIGPK